MEKAEVNENRGGAGGEKSTGGAAMSLATRRGSLLFSLLYRKFGDSGSESRDYSLPPRSGPLRPACKSKSGLKGEEERLETVMRGRGEG